MTYNDRVHHEQLRERFRKVIIGAGYSGDAPGAILAEWFDKYIVDIPKFEAMLERYENNDYDPE